MAITQSTINHLLLTNLEKCIDNGTDSFIVMALTDWSFGIMLISVGISFYVEDPELWKNLYAWLRSYESGNVQTSGSTFSSFQRTRCENLTRVRV